MRSALLATAALLGATSSWAADAAKDQAPNATLTIHGVSQQVTLTPLTGAHQEVQRKPTKAPPKPPASLHLGTRSDVEQHAPPASPHHKLVDQWVGWRGGFGGYGWRRPWYGGGYPYYSRPFYSTGAYSDGYDYDDGYYGVGYSAPSCTCQY